MSNYVLLKNNRNFRFLFLSKFLSDFGSQLQRFGIPWLIYESTNSGSLMAFNFILSLLPGLLFGFLGGKIADKYDRKKILILSDCLSFLSTLILLILYLIEFDNKTIFLFGITFILSTISALCSPSFTAILPNVVDKQEIVTANSIYGISDSINSLLGPIIANVFIAIIGAWITILFNSISFFVSVVLIFLVKMEPKNKIKIELETEKRLFADIKRILHVNGWLKKLLLLAAIFYFVLGVIGSTLQYFLINKLNLSGLLLGLTFVIFEFIPMLFASILAPKLHSKFQYEQIIYIGILVFSLTLIGMGLTTEYQYIIILGMVQNFFGTSALIAWASVRQEKIINSELGRISGLVVALQSLMLPIGSLVIAFLIKVYDIQLMFTIIGSISAILLIIIGIYLKTKHSI